MASTTSSNVGAGPSNTASEPIASDAFSSASSASRKASASGVSRSTAPASAHRPDAARGGRNRGVGPKAMWGGRPRAGRWAWEGIDRTRSDDERPGAPAGAAGGQGDRRDPVQRRPCAAVGRLEQVHDYRGPAYAPGGAGGAARGRDPGPRVRLDGGTVRRPIDPVDTIWLNMDRANNLMVIESLMTCADPIDRERFLEVLRTRVLDRFPVFSQRPVSSRMPLAMPHWEDVPDFDPGAHVRQFTLPPPGDDSALQDHVNGFISTPLPRDRPLWEMHLIAGYAGGSALYSRLHHSMADGIALTRVLLSMTVTRNPATAVAGTAGVRKRAVWAPPIPLRDVIAAGHRTGTTVNDVLVAALAGAVSTYLRDHDGTAVDLPTMVPVNVRPLDEPLPRELGNRFALMLFSLPSGLDTPFARLAETKRRMDAIKHSPEAVITFGMIRGIGRTGKDLERYLV